MAYEAYYQARDTLLDFIRRDAIGPVREDEVLDEPPLEMYACGILWPKRVKVVDNDEEDGDQDATDGDLEEDSSEVIAGTNRYRPSVMAISFVLPADQSTVEAQFDAAYYEHEVGKEEKYTRHFYSRRPIQSGRMRLPLDDGFAAGLFEGRAMLHIFLRRTYRDGSRMWTVSVENITPHSRREIEENCRALFQCQLKLYGQFLPIDNIRFAVGKDDRQLQDLLYRDVHQYAAGHGCSVQWEDYDGEMEIYSDFLPYATVSQMVATVPVGKYNCFRMDFWQDSTKADAIRETREYIQD